MVAGVKSVSVTEHIRVSYPHWWEMYGAAHYYSYNSGLGSDSVTPRPSKRKWF
jgi:hypothetical protein